MTDRFAPQYGRFTTHDLRRQQLDMYAIAANICLSCWVDPVSERLQCDWCITKEIRERIKAA